jgi:hypothetical protein
MVFLVCVCVCVCEKEREREREERVYVCVSEFNSFNFVFVKSYFLKCCMYP